MASTGSPAAVAATLALASLALPAAGLDNGAAITPPMGFSTWNKLRCNFNETVLLEVADALVQSGMVEAGYRSINIDDCWPLMQRAANGDIVPNPEKFPDGMASFSAKLASRGISLGIYTAHGPKTCQGYPGSLGHEVQDATMYASWNVTFVKNDWCWRLPNITSQMHLNAFNTMRDALNATGKHMVHSIHWNTVSPCPTSNKTGGEVDCPMPDTANMWRIGGDIRPMWSSVLRLIDTDANHSAAAGPGHWNDADMLEVGNGMTTDQDRGHFTMWCMLSSPLVAGNDPRSMTEATSAIYTNKMAISINQDPLGQQAEIAVDGNSTQVWVKKLSSGAMAVAMLNRGSTTTTISFKLPSGSNSFTAFDVWNDGKSVSINNGELTAKVNGTTAALYKLIPTLATM